MAGDWIKVRCDLQTHPKVVRILSAIRLQDVQCVSDKFRVIGGLHAVWTVFDQHTVDGRLPGYTPEIMDHVVGFDGLCQAMIDVGWLTTEGAETLVMPEFDEHNGKGGKRRAEDQKRKRNARKTSESCPQSVRNLSAEDRTREEKRRKEKDIGHSDRFGDFWQAYPKKVKKAEAKKKWKAKKLDRIADQIISDIQERGKKDRRWLDGFVPDPTTYINGERWDDEIDSSRSGQPAEKARPESRILNP